MTQGYPNIVASLIEMHGNRGTSTINYEAILLELVSTVRSSVVDVAVFHLCAQIRPDRRDV